MSDKERLSAFLMLAGIGWLSYQAFWAGVDTASALKVSIQAQQVVEVKGGR